MKSAIPNSLLKVQPILILILTILLSGSCVTSRKLASQQSVSLSADYNNTRRHDYFFHEGVRQATEGNYAEAFELMQYCIRADSTSAAAKYHLAQYYILLNDKTMPEKLLLEALHEEPDNYWYRRLLAMHYRHTRKYGVAIREYEEIVRRFPQRTEILLNLAELYNDIGQYEKELQAINRYGLLEDAYDELRSQRFLCYLKMEELDSAYHEVASSAADAMEALMQSVNNLAGLELVMRFCAVVEKHDPSLWQTYRNISLAKYQTDKRNEAFAAISRGLRNVTDSIGLSSLYSLRGEFHHDMNHMDLTYQDYDSVLIYNPNEISILNNYAYFLSLENRDLQRALNMSSKTINAEPENPTFLDTYAWILFKLNRYSEALKYIELAMQNGGEQHPAVVEHCGDINYHCGNKEKALKYWHEAIRLKSDSKLLEQKILQEKYIE